MPYFSKLEPKRFSSSIIFLSTRPASKLNHVAGTPLPKQVTSAKNDNIPNIIATMKDVNQPNHSTELPFSIR